MYVQDMEANICSMPTDATPLAHAALTVDSLERILIESEAEIARQRASQVAALQLLDRAQAATADGARNLTEWVARRLDVGVETAKTLVRTMRRTEDRNRLREALADGTATFDRVEAASRIDDDDPDPLFLHLEVDGVHREAAIRARKTSAEERRTIADSHLLLQPSLDRSWFKVWGGMDGMLGAMVDGTLSELADRLPVDPNLPQSKDGAWRRAMALAELCAGDDPPPAQITVFIDAAIAVATDGEGGVYLQAGPTVGREALDAVLCDSIHSVIVDSEQGQPLRYGKSSRSIPATLRRAVIHRDGNRCVIDGSRNRLQVHHIVPSSQGGPTEAENLITLCWFHHHVAIHRLGLVLYRHPDHGRWGLRRPSRAPPS
jgi:hypothetical protein